MSPRGWGRPACSTAQARHRRRTRRGTARPAASTRLGAPDRPSATTRARHQEPGGGKYQQGDTRVVEDRGAVFALPTASGREEVRISLAVQNRSPSGLRLAGPDPCRQGHGAFHVQRRRCRHAHHLAGALEPHRAAKPAPGRPGRPPGSCRRFHCLRRRPPWFRSPCRMRTLPRGPPPAGSCRSRLGSTSQRALRNQSAPGYRPVPRRSRRGSTPRKDGCHRSHRGSLVLRMVPTVARLDTWVPSTYSRRVPPSYVSAK